MTMGWPEDASQSALPAPVLREIFVVDRFGRSFKVGISAVHIR
jgi:hypothetical protein